MRPDLVGIIESLYQLERGTTSSWIGETLERLMPWVGDGLGLFGFLYAVSPEGQLQQSSFASVGCPEALVEALPFAAAQHEPDFIHTGYLAVDFAAATEIPGWGQSDGGKIALRDCVKDVWAIIGRNPGRQGCAMMINRSNAGAPPRSQRDTLVR